MRHARPGTVVLEMSTISPDTSRKLANLGTEVGVHVLDVVKPGVVLGLAIVRFRRDLPPASRKLQAPEPTLEPAP